MNLKRRVNALEAEHEPKGPVILCLPKGEPLPPEADRPGVIIVFFDEIDEKL